MQLQEKIINFKWARLPQIYFGAGTFQEFPKILEEFSAKCILLVTGKKSFDISIEGQILKENLKKSNIYFEQIKISGEPTPNFIDTICEEYRQKNISLVCAIGGGSVLDSGKAISAMLLHKNESVKDYLEGIGEKEYCGPKIPFVAIPTTAGTGSEVTKNAVLSQIGKNGFKRSLRHDLLIPEVAICDPRLMLTAPQNITAACGMDAFTQLLEAFVSTKSNPFSDALCWSGMQAVARSLTAAYQNGNDLLARTDMAYAALVSGIVLANVGLGVIHGCELLAISPN